MEKGGEGDVSDELHSLDELDRMSFSETPGSESGAVHARQKETQRKSEDPNARDAHASLLKKRLSEVEDAIHKARQLYREEQRRLVSFQAKRATLSQEIAHLEKHVRAVSTSLPEGRLAEIASKEKSAAESLKAAMDMEAAAAAVLAEARKEARRCVDEAKTVACNTTKDSDKLRPMEPLQAMEFGGEQEAREKDSSPATALKLEARMTALTRAADQCHEKFESEHGRLIAARKRRADIEEEIRQLKEEREATIRSSPEIRLRHAEEREKAVAKVAKQVEVMARQAKAQAIDEANIEIVALQAEMKQTVRDANEKTRKVQVQAARAIEEAEKEMAREVARHQKDELSRERAMDELRAENARLLVTAEEGEQAIEESERQRETIEHLEEAIEQEGSTVRAHTLAAFGESFVHAAAEFSDHQWDWPKTIATIGSGPFDEDEFDVFLQRFDFKAVACGYDTGVLIVGRHSDLDVVGEHIEKYEDQSLRIYSQEMAFLMLASGCDPFDCKMDVLLEFAEGHPVLEILAKRADPWPLLSFGMGDGVFEVDAGGWHELGPLKAMGYKVGYSGLSDDSRQDILTKAVEGNLRFPADYSRNERQRWGLPRTEARLKVIAHEIAKFANTLGNRDVDMSCAVREWNDDLAWLKKKYYNRRKEMLFSWPRIG